MKRTALIAPRIAPSHPLSHTAQPGRTASVLLPLIPAEWLRGPVVQVVEAGDGIVTVIHTPNPDFGAYEVTAWRARRVCDIEADLTELDYAPLIEYTTSRLLQDETGIQDAITEIAQSLGVEVADASDGWFPLATLEAAQRAVAVVEQIERAREQVIADQVEAAYAEYADQSKVRDWMGSAA